MRCYGMRLDLKWNWHSWWQYHRDTHTPPFHSRLLSFPSYSLSLASSAPLNSRSCICVTLWSAVTNLNNYSYARVLLFFVLPLFSTLIPIKLNRSNFGHYVRFFVGEFCLCSCLANGSTHDEISCMNKKWYLNFLDEKIQLFQNSAFVATTPAAATTSFCMSFFFVCFVSVW